MGHKDESREPIHEPDRDQSLAEVLEQALSQLNSGAEIEQILARFPVHAEALRPMLRAARAVRQVPPPMPEASAKQAGLERLMAAVESKLDAQFGQVPQQTIETALEDALARLREGEAMPVVLARYPAFAEEMRPMLQVAEAVRRTPLPIPDEKAYFAGRARVVKLAARRRREREEAKAPTASSQGRQLVDLVSQLLGTAPALRRAAITVVLLIAMILGGFSVTQVAADSLPNSPLYPVKRFTERVQLVLTPSTEAKAKLHKQFSEERLRETERLASQTGQVDVQVLNAMLTENDRYLDSIKNISSERQRGFASDGARLFLEQRRVLAQLADTDSPLTPEQRAMLQDYVGEAGNDQAIAEEVQRDTNLADFIPSPAPRAEATATPLPSPTPRPTRVIEEQVKPTSVPATATSVPPTLTPSQPPPEVVMEPAQPTAPPTSTATQTPLPPLATAAPADTPPPAPAPATSVPTEPAAPSPTVEIGMPTLPPLETPSP